MPSGLTTLFLGDAAVASIRSLAHALYDNRTLLELHLSGNVRVGRSVGQFVGRSVGRPSERNLNAGR